MSDPVRPRFLLAGLAAALLLTAAGPPGTTQALPRALELPLPPPIGAVAPSPVFPPGVGPVTPRPEPKPLPKIDPRSPLKDLLPVPPAVKKAPVYLGEDLSRVPELAFEAAPAKKLSTEQWTSKTGHAVAAALFLNGKEEDGYLKAALKGRADLAGLPFLMGDACRTRGKTKKAFKEVARSMRVETAKEIAASIASLADALKGLEADRKDLRDGVDYPALIAALSQITGPESHENRIPVARLLGLLPRPQATRELARMAVFSFDRTVREAALEALTLRRERDYAGVLESALRYPWPAVARNAAEAIVKLERTDLTPNLVALLDEPDPRGPREEKGTAFVRELVRVNHHKNCMMCHAPADPANPDEDALIAPIPLPSEPMPTREYYRERPATNLLVRIDVTYLRQDFSVMQEVDRAAPWPEMQRFDFVVRKRSLTAAEAADVRKRLETREPGVLSPYQQAAVNALRKMTGRDFEAKAAVWRRFLKLEGS
jgi:hypothetical protein